MLYIFDLGNVVVNLDYTRALGVWSNLSGAPLAHLQQHFQADNALDRYERGEIDDRQFAELMCAELQINLSYPQFVSGWLAVFTRIEQPVVEQIQRLRADGRRVVILSNMNNLHRQYLARSYPQLLSSADHCYFSDQLGVRKPATAFYQAVLSAEDIPAQQAIYCVAEAEDLDKVRQLGIGAFHYHGPQSLESGLAAKPFTTRDSASL